MGNLLVVDDDEEILEVLEDILQEKGHHVTTALGGKRALDELSSHQFDLALIDLKMEDISGFDVIRVINREYPDIVTIVSTGYASLDYAIEALRLGAYDFLQKPVRAELLITAVERGLEKKQLADLSEAVIRKMDEGIALLDSEWSMDFANERFPEMLGYSPNKFQGNSFLSIVSPEDEGSVVQCLRQINKGEPQRIQVSLVRNDGVELVAVVSFTNIGKHILTVVSDVTSIVNPTVIGQELTYRVEPGHIYLVGEEKPEKALEAFFDLVDAGYKGIIITRSYLDEIKANRKGEVPILRLTEEVSGESTLFPDLALIGKKMEPYFSRNRVILVDRLDYLVSTNSFEEVLSSVQRIRDLVFIRKSVVILTIDPRTLEEREFSLLEKETSPLVRVSEPEVREDLIELLKYLEKRNEIGKKPHHKEIGKKFNITRTTVRQRLKILHDKGMIIEKKKGRSKVVEITNRGRKLLSSF